MCNINSVEIHWQSETLYRQIVGVCYFALLKNNIPVTRYGLIDEKEQ